MSMWHDWEDVVLKIALSMEFFPLCQVRVSNNSAVSTTSYLYEQPNLFASPCVRGFA